MDRLGIVICNYNKKEYVEKNIASLYRQTKKDFDIIVVDNASTDGSVDYLRNLYGGRIEIICNDENLGGSGGFNTGLRLVLDRGYEYIMLLDNDVVLAENCVEKGLEILDANSDIGMLGFKIMRMDFPDTIQEFAPSIDYDGLRFVLNHKGEKDSGQLPKLAEADYIPACAMITRSIVLNSIGLIPEENFIYYDDITWCIRCRRAGYRVSVTSEACVWHKGGGTINPRTFSTYYLTRNRIRFFMRFFVKDDNSVTEEDINNRTENILKEIFEGLYSCKINNMPNAMQTRMDGFLDALFGIGGKAEDYKIRPREIPEARFRETVRQAHSIVLYMNDEVESTRRVVNGIFAATNEGTPPKVTIVADPNKVGEELLGCRVVSEIEQADTDLELHICKHVFETDINSIEKKWIDGWTNLVLDEADLNNCRLFRESYVFFRKCFYDRVKQCILSGLNRGN